MEIENTSMTTEELYERLKATVENMLRTFGNGDGVLILLTTETGMRLESFNMNTEEIASALECAYDVVVEQDEDNRIPDGEILQ